MECRAYGCTQALTGRQREFCSDKCRKRASRTQTTPEDGSGSTNADRMAVEPGQTERGQQSRTRPSIPPPDPGCIRLVVGPASLDDYLDEHGRHYAPRAHPELLNWGDWMTSLQLEQAGLKANRVPIPSDWDYEGVAQATGACTC